MSLDDHISRLTDTITSELRAPIQQSLRTLLSEVLAAAGAEQAEARKAWDETRASLEAQIAKLRDDHEASLAAADSSKDEILAGHAAAMVALRTQFEDDRHAAEQALRDQLAREQEARLAEVREEAAAEVREQALAERHAAEEALQEDLTRERQAAEEALRQQLVEAHEAHIAALTTHAQAERQALEQAIREQLAREHQSHLDELTGSHEAGIARMRDEVTSEIGQSVWDEARKLAAEEQAAAMARAREELTAEVGQAVLVEARKMAAEEERALREELAAEFAVRLHSVTAAHEHAIARLREEVTAEVGQSVLDEARKVAAEEAVSREADLGALIRAERTAEMACGERLLGAVTRLDEARTLNEAMRGLLDLVSVEAARTAIFLVNGERLRPWRTSGFLAPQEGQADMPVDEAGPIGLAVRNGAAISTSDNAIAALSLPPWLVPHPGRAGLAVPITVGGRVVAVLYADDAGRGDEVPRGNWPEVLEILARHAGRCLEVLTFARVSAPRPPQPVRSLEQPPAAATAIGPDEDSRQQEESARRYARLLISEVKLYNETTVEDGRRHGDILARLGPEIERARRLYEEKIPAAVRERAGWFEEELVRTLAGGDIALLGQVT